MTLSIRHREWGYDCPVLDIDFLEYDGGKAVALIEAKKHGETAMSKYDRKALRDLADRAGLPAFGVRHTIELSQFLVTPLNPFAQEFFAKNSLDAPTAMDERAYVNFLYLLRNRPLPSDIDFSQEVEVVVLTRMPCQECAEIHSRFHDKSQEENCR